jgi:hypothetical protein
MPGPPKRRPMPPSTTIFAASRLPHGTVGVIAVTTSTPVRRMATSSRSQRVARDGRTDTMISSKLPSSVTSCIA